MDGMAGTCLGYSSCDSHSLSISIELCQARRASTVVGSDFDLGELHRVKRKGRHMQFWRTYLREVSWKTCDIRFFCALGPYEKSNERHRTKQTQNEMNRKRKENHKMKNRIKTNTQKWKKTTKDWMKRNRKIRCLQGANPVYHRGKGPLQELSRFFFGVLGRDGKSNEPHRKNQTQLWWQEKKKKTWGKQA